MKFLWKRILFAITTSLLMFAATIAWYFASDNKIQRNDKANPLAFIDKAKDDVERRPTSRLLWQNVYDGDALYDGEAVRTSAKNNVVIQFAGSNNYLDLEPNSLILIKKDKGQIALDLMEGHLFVSAKEKSNDNETHKILVNTDKGQINLTGSSSNISKASDKAMEVRVLEGTASVTNINGNEQSLESGKVNLLTEKGLEQKIEKIQTIYPQPEQVTYVDTKNLSKTAFTWKADIPKAHYQLLVGSERNNLKEITQTVAPQKLTISTELVPGKYYWKVVAKTQDNTYESEISKFEIKPLILPTVIFPTNDLTVYSANKTNEINFVLQKDAQTSKIILEIADNPNFTKILQSQVSEKDATLKVSNLDWGTYYWRMTSYTSGMSEAHTSQIQKFTFKQKQTNLVNITWPSDGENQLYGQEPTLQLKWLSSQNNIVNRWRIKVLSDEAEPQLVKNAEVYDTKAATVLNKPGRYIASIEAIDSNGDVIGSSTQKKFSIASAPLLKAPEYIMESTTLLGYMDSGSEIKWKIVPGAKEYEIKVLKDGKEVYKNISKTTQALVRDLSPGDYVVQLKAIDEYDRASENIQTQNLKISKNKEIKAPTLKKIKVSL